MRHIDIENFVKDEVQMKLYIPNKFRNHDRFTDLKGGQEFKERKGVDHLTGMEFSFTEIKTK